MVIFYPLRPTPLILILLISFGVWLGFVYLILSILFISITCLAIITFSKFLFVVLDYRANGFNDNPMLKVTTLQPFGEWRHIQLIFIIATQYFFLSFFFNEGLKLIASLLLFFCVFTLPACMALITVSRSIIIALSPLAQLKFIKLAGFQYGVMLTCIVALGMLTNYLVANEHSPFFIVFSLLYSLMLTFNWLGIIIFHRRFALDFNAENSPEIAEAEAEKVMQLARNMCLYRACREYPNDNSISIILKYIDEEEVNVIAAHQWFADELDLLENKGLAKRHSKHHIEALNKAGKMAMAKLIDETNAIKYATNYNNT